MSCVGDWSSRDKRHELRREFIENLNWQEIHAQYDDNTPNVINEDTSVGTEWCMMEGHILQTEQNEYNEKLSYIERRHYSYMLDSDFDQDNF